MKRISIRSLEDGLFVRVPLFFTRCNYFSYVLEKKSVERTWTWVLCLAQQVAPQSAFSSVQNDHLQTSHTTAMRSGLHGSFSFSSSSPSYVFLVKLYVPLPPHCLEIIIWQEKQLPRRTPRNISKWPRNISKWNFCHCLRLHTGYSSGCSVWVEMNRENITIIIQLSPLKCKS